MTDQVVLPEAGNFDEFRKAKKAAAKSSKEADLIVRNADFPNAAELLERGVAAKAEEPDDKIEDDEGLTAAERKAYSEKIARKISAKHRALKQAEAAIGKETQGRQAAEKLASEFKAEIEVLKKGVPKDDGKGPKREDYPQTDEGAAAWWDAKIDWKAEQKAEAKYTALEQRREQEKLETAKQARIAAFAATVDDYDEAVESLKGLPQHQAVLDYLVEAELGPNLIHYFGSHTDEYEKLTKMKPVAAVAEVGKIESRLERKADKAEKTKEADEALDKLKSPISRAPAPISAIPEGVNPVKKDLTTINNFDEYRRAKRAQGL